MQPVVGVWGAAGEERIASRVDWAPRVGVSSCSTRDARWFGVYEGVAYREGWSARTGLIVMDRAPIRRGYQSTYLSWGLAASAKTS